MDRNKKDGPAGPRRALPETRREAYAGHEIVLPTDERNKRLSIDGRTVYYRINARGEYYLDKYAYDRAKSLDGARSARAVRVDAVPELVELIREPPEIRADRRAVATGHRDRDRPAHLARRPDAHRQRQERELFARTRGHRADALARSIEPYAG